MYEVHAHKGDIDDLAISPAGNRVNITCIAIINRLRY